MPRQNNTVSATLEVITPTTAAGLLARNMTNRNVRQRHVDFLAGVMRRGEWVVNGETIIITKSGRLSDGQHRLHAVVQSGTSIETWVVRGVDEGVMPTIDTGVARTASDNLGIAGVKNAAAMGSMIRMLHAFTSYNFLGQSTKMSNVQVLNAYASLPDIARADEMITACYRDNFKNICTFRGHFVAFCYMVEHAGTGSTPPLMTEFFSAVTTGVTLPGDPAFALRDRWHQTSLARARGQQVTRQAWTHLLVRAWNAHYSRQSIRYFSLHLKRNKMGNTLPRGVSKQDAAELHKALFGDDGGES